MLLLLGLVGFANAAACPEKMEQTCYPKTESIHTIYNTTASGCCKACVDNTACMAYTLNMNGRVRCYLHPITATAPVTAKGNCISGEVRKPVPPKPAPPAPKGAKNVLFFISDDLRPEMFAPYGQKQAITPYFDKLASESMVFNRAYCQQAICGPTRNSFLSGRRPQRTKSWNFIDHFREAGVGANWTSFPGYFLNHGYTTLGGGKTYHPGLPPNNDGAKSWSTQGDSPAYVNNGDSSCTSDYTTQKSSKVCPDNKTDYMQFTDYANLQGMIQSLRYAANKTKEEGRPFFINFGIHKPHLPFHFPEVFPDGRNIWKAYSDEDIALPKHEVAPKGMPGIAFTYELDGKTEFYVLDEQVAIPGPDQTNSSGGPCPFCGPKLPDNATRTMRKGYYSAVSWTDYCMGQLLGELERLGHKDDTVVALVGDHGWQLGEHNIWGKHTNFELGTRVPLIIRSVGQTKPVRSDALVESVDIYPTVARLAGLPLPPDVDGYDLSPLWADPTSSVKDVAFSEYPRCGTLEAPWSDTTSCVHTPRTNFNFMGYSIRTDTWRCVLWMHWDGQNLRGDFRKPPAAVELYDHHGDTELDFDAFENENVAESNPNVVAQMLARAKKQWGGENSM